MSIKNTICTFNDSITLPSSTISLTVDDSTSFFECDGKKWSRIGIGSSIGIQFYRKYNGSQTEYLYAYRNGAWGSDEYKQISIFSEQNQSTEAFEEWIKSNGTITRFPTYAVSGYDLFNIASAIRAKTGGSSSLAFPNDFISGIESIGG